MRIPSGVTDQYVYFVAVDSTDLKTRETGLSSFTVYRSRDGAAAAAYTTPTVNETDVTNMPGVYELLLDEDMTIASGNDSEEVCLHITQASMAPVTRTFELYRRTATAGETIGVASAAVSNVTTTATATAVTTVNGLAANVITAAATHADFTTEIQSGLATAAALATVDGIVDDILLDTAEIGAAGAGLTAINLPNQTMDIVGSITGSLSGSVGSVTGAVGSVTGAVGSVTGAVGSVTGAVGSVTGLTASNLDATVSSRLATAGYTAPDNTSIAAILTDTGTTLDARIPAALVGGRMDSSTGAMAAAVVTAAAVATDAIDADALAADAVTEIWAKAMAELAGPPAATGTVLQAMTFLFMALRNLRATTATADVITNDAGATIATATLSDDATTFTKTEYV